MDTDLHFQETYNLIDEVKATYPELRIEMKKPDLTLEEQANRHNPALWKNNLTNVVISERLNHWKRSYLGLRLGYQG